MGFVGAIYRWLGRLTDEMNYVDKLVIFLEDIGCFDSKPHPTTASARVRQESPSTRPTSSNVPQGESASFPLGKAREQASCVDKRGAAGNSPGESNLSTTEDIASQAPGDFIGCGGNGNSMENGRSFGEITRLQMQEAIDGLRFHLVVLQRAVDKAHIELRAANRKFAWLLMKVGG